MPEAEFRIEHDSLGEVRVPAGALYGAQTQRAVENFPISGIRFPRAFIGALALIKGSAAAVHRRLNLLAEDMATAIEDAAREVEDGLHDSQFPVDIYQTGSGTSTNMNANEVIATLASAKLGRAVHPNDHVNLGQSSNDVVPATIHLSVYRAIVSELIPALDHLRSSIDHKAENVQGVIKTGRTHLMDAMPMRLSQEMSGWSGQIRDSAERLRAGLSRLAELPLGATAIGTGVNTHPEFGTRVTDEIARRTGYPFRISSNYFAALSGAGAEVETSGHLKALAVALTKISNDLRWMNSGPVSGLGEIRLAALQPGSSIMPGKVNPVIPEAVLMVCARVIGNDTSVTLAGQSANFELNVMLPLIAHCLLESTHYLTRSCTLLADLAIRPLKVNEESLRRVAEQNPILGTVLTPLIGYEKSAEIVKRALLENRSVREIAREMTDLSAEQLDRLLNLEDLTGAG